MKTLENMNSTKYYNPPTYDIRITEINISDSIDENASTAHLVPTHRVPRQTAGAREGLLVARNYIDSCGISKQTVVIIIG